MTRQGGNCLEALRSQFTVDIPESIKRNPSIAGTLQRAQNADIAFIGIGAMKDSMYVRYGYIKPEVIRAMREGPFVGEALGQFYASGGRVAT